MPIANVNGAEIYFTEQGAGVPLLLLHGGFSSSESWGPIVPRLAERFRVITPDSRGHGLSTDPSGNMSYPLFADDMASLIAELELDRPFVAGWSDGGQIAIEIGIRHPGLARALVASGTIVDFGAEYQALIRGMFAMDEDRTIDVQQLTAMWGDMLPPDDGSGTQGAPSWVPLVQRIASMWLDYPGLTESQLAKIQTPVLVVAGDHDEMANLDQAMRLYHWLPQVELAVCPAADHNLPSAHLEWFARTLQEFIDRQIVLPAVPAPDVS